MNMPFDIASRCAVVAALGLCVCSASAADRPNVLLIMSDEHNAAVTGCYGNDIVQTPTLDALAGAGVTFDACYTNSPLCVPCRLSFTAGKYVSRVGAWSNNCWLPSDEIPSIARVMAAAGYDSLLCGKMHYDKTRRYGFQEIEPIGNNSFKTGAGGRRKADDLVSNKPLSPRFEDFHPGDNSGILSHDRKVTAALQKFLKQRSSSHKPFFLVAGYLAPHFPLIVPNEYWEHYKGRVPQPEIPAGYLDSQSLNYRHLRAGFQMQDVPVETVLKGRELYYGLTEWLDNELGKVIRTLDESDLAENTVVIYTTDHGENLGEHGLWWKNCMYESAARVPLIIRWPQRWDGGQRRAGACSLVDVVQSVVQLGGATAPEDWDGDSLIPWLDNADYDWKDLAISEYYAHNICSGYVMLRSGRYKLVYHTRPDAQHPPERELYDLVSDPGELHNLASNPEYANRVRELEAKLVAELGEHPEETELRCRADYARTYQRVKKAKKAVKRGAASRRQSAAQEK